jgi:flagella basal body P-ring formation protein FlgA
MKFFLVVFLFSSLVWAKPEVVFTSPVEVSARETMRLGDLVQISQPTEELLAVLDSVTIKTKDHYEASEISSLIKNEMEANASLRKLNPSFRIPGDIKLQVSKTPISRAEVERKILNVLRARCGDCEYRVAIQNIPFPATGPWEIDYASIANKGAFLISVKDSDARGLKWISGTTRVSQMVPVATRLLQGGERVQVGDAKMALVDTTFVKDTGLALSDLNGQLLQRPIQTGNPIFSADLKREAAAKRGQVIRGISGSPDFEISLNLEAQENGFIGDTIRLKNPETQKVFSGLVVDKGVVKIQ